MDFYTRFNEYIELIDLRDIKNKPMSKSKIIKIIDKNKNYMFELLRISQMYNVCPELLEYVLGNITLPLESTKIPRLKKLIAAKRRFLDVRKENNEIIIEGVYKGRYYRIVLNNKMIFNCSNLIKYISESPKEFILNGEKITLYTLMDKIHAVKIMIMYHDRLSVSDLIRCNII